MRRLRQLKQKSALHGIIQKHGNATSSSGPSRQCTRETVSLVLDDPSDGSLPPSGAAVADLPLPFFSQRDSKDHRVTAAVGRATWRCFPCWTRAACASGDGHLSSLPSNGPDPAIDPLCSGLAHGELDTSGEFRPTGVRRADGARMRLIWVRTLPALVATVCVDYPRGDEGTDVPYGNAVRRVEQGDERIGIVMEIYQVALEVVHQRQFDYQPGKQLRVIDTLRSDRPGPRRFVQWHHFAREFELTGQGGRFQADHGELPVDIEVSSSCGDRTTYETIKGQTEPRIQGWASLASRERHPRWALGVACEAKTASFIADFALAR